MITIEIKGGTVTFSHPILLDSDYLPPAKLLSQNGLRLASGICALVNTKLHCTLCSPTPQLKLSVINTRDKNFQTSIVEKLQIRDYSSIVDLCKGM